MTATATIALQAALHFVSHFEEVDPDDAGMLIGGEIMTAAELRQQILRGLESLRQGPAMLDTLGVDTRLRAASRKAGSDAALARQIGITRQSLADVMSGRREPGPAVLSYLRLRKVSPGRTLCTPLDDEVRSKAPRSERRQRAWDGLSVTQTDSVAAP
ncbi:helix-turn-helix domain-containing protein [Devosia salina]|uniref:Helix-turn-helix transcriptional regulator n=1 Tax=Devosia salina TaxID=2860336 RepID=A0ABX8WHP8_9HYPH|nr:helix-turn-helix transcriptional regulator [Devosia salina]QYO78404.1 helix-turn-helix transcriptional regulator [Devosia salina]